MEPPACTVKRGQGRRTGFLFMGWLITAQLLPVHTASASIPSYLGALHP